MLLFHTRGESWYNTPMDPPRITAFSTPLISTWVLDETHRILFDVGDGTAAMLEGKVHKANVVALTHAHRDHVAGLPQFLNLRGGVAHANGEDVCIFHPDGSGSILALSRFLSHFDQMTAGFAQWQAWHPGDQTDLGNSRFLRAYETHHIPCPEPGRFRSLGYQIGRFVDRLRPELRDLPQAALDRLRAEQGRDAITVREQEIILTVSGDTTPMPAERIAGTRFLLHECTFLDADEARCAPTADRGHEHSCLSDVLDLIEAASVEHAALYHISKRYTDDEIIKTIRGECARRDLRARLSIVLPGRVCSDVFGQILWPPKG